METIAIFPSFGVTAILWKDISEKFEFYNLNAIGSVLNPKLSIENYGSGVKELVFIFIAVLPNNTVHEEETTYLPDEKKLLIYRKLPYEKVVAYTKAEVLRLMTETYLKAIKELESFQIPDFDFQRLYRDVQKIFVELGWVLSDNFQSLSRTIKPETVTAFLSSKNWNIQESSSRYQVMLPPKDNNTLKNKCIYIPLFSESCGDKYERAWSDVITMLADIYQMDRLELELLFSKSQEQIKSDNGMLQAMFLHFK